MAAYTNIQAKNKQTHKLGTLQTSEDLIRDLYLDLRNKIRYWAGITKQTAQARMGYIGQHLVSVVTGFPGGKSGARGRDLILPGNKYAEIKTCYKVDQLGMCNICKVPVASIELKCDVCGGTDIKRNDDSKWLIGIRNVAELSEIIDPQYYYFVLFEFSDQAVDQTIEASIWQVDSQVPGFALCMIHYYYNIGTKSKSGAPLNLWPHHLKFELMRPKLIYMSTIDEHDAINTSVFPGLKGPEQDYLESLPKLARAKILTQKNIAELATILKIKLLKNKKADMLEEIENHINKEKVDRAMVADIIAKIIYLPNIKSYIGQLPPALRKYVNDIK